jgi:hypothetical protein
MLKAQVNIHFIISLTIFVGLILYLVFVLISTYPVYDDETRTNILYSKAYQVSEFLIKDTGYSNDWNVDNYVRIGLASEPYLLNQLKINNLNVICDDKNATNVERLLSSFGLFGNSLAIEIRDFNGTSILQCYPGGRSLNLEVALKRIAVLNRSFVEVVVYVG